MCVCVYVLEIVTKTRALVTKPYARPMTEDLRQKIQSVSTTEIKRCGEKGKNKGKTHTGHARAGKRMELDELDSHTQWKGLSESQRVRT